MSTKRVLTYIGIILIVLQAISFLGMSKMYVGLYPDSTDLLYPQHVSDSDLNLRKAMFAVEAGTDRFLTGFGDLAYGEDDYRVMTAEQMTSAMIRESLNCRSGRSISLNIYDTILTISYCLAGIVGIVLLIVAFKFKKDNDSSCLDKTEEGGSSLNEEYVEEDDASLSPSQDASLAKTLLFFGIVVIVLLLLIYILS